MTFKNKNWFYKENGKKGGRPKQDSNIHIELPEATLVILTPGQYDTLLNKYGDKIINKAIVILEHWLKFGGKSSEKFRGRNNYAHFRSDGWLINEAIRQISS